MLTLRRQLPVYSPVRFASLLRGASGALGAGRPRERLAALVAEHFGTSDLLLTDSGTSALRLAIAAATEAAATDEKVVLLPAFCCYDVATAAVGAGVRVRLYDVDPDTLAPDAGSLEDGLRAGAAAVVLVHLYGLPVDVPRWAGVAAAAGAVVIEDAAQGFGGRWKGRPLGSGGSLGVLSFGRGKGVTGGGGGALLANDEAGRRTLERVRGRAGPGARGWGALSKLAAQWALGRPSIYGLPASLPWLGLGETHYRTPWPPAGIARGPAAAAVANWEASSAEAGRRRERARQLADLALPGVAAALEAGACPLRLPLPLAATGATVAPPVAEREGIVRSYPRPLGALPAAGRWETPPAGCPGAEALARGLWTAPTHSASDPGRVRRILTERLRGGG